MKILLSLSAMALLGTTAAKANDGAFEEKIEDFYFSEGCGDFDLNVVKFGMGEGRDGKMVMNEALEIGLLDFGTFIDEKGINSRDCMMEVVIKVPAGKRFRAVSAVSQGIYSFSEKGGGSVSIDYSVDELGSNGFYRWDSERGATGSWGAPKEAQSAEEWGNNSNNGSWGQPGNDHKDDMKPEPIPKSGDFTLKADLNSNEFTECKEFDSTVTLVTKLSARSWSRENDINEILFDTVDVDSEKKASSIVWDWDWQKCNDNSNPFANRSFEGRLSNNGQFSGASVDFFKDSGRYSSQYSGTFSNVRYDAERDRIEGQWHSSGWWGNNTGWFYLEMKNRDSGETFGEWGYNGQNYPSGQWNLHYK